MQREDYAVAKSARLAFPNKTVAGSAEPALAASSLSLIGRDGCPLDVAAVGYSDRHILIGDQILDGKLHAFIDDFRSPAVTEICLHFFEFIDDYPSQRCFITKYLLQFGNQLDDLLVLVDGAGRAAARILALAPRASRLALITGVHATSVEQTRLKSRVPV